MNFNDQIEVVHCKKGLVEKAFTQPSAFRFVGTPNYCVK